MKRLILCVALSCVPACVQATTYQVSLDTSPLVGSAAGPFSVSFQMSDGSGTGDGNNAAILSAFMFGTGASSGSPLLIGSALGDLSSGVVFTDASGIAFFAQTFTPGSVLQFQLDLTTNVDGGPIADAFTFFILDSTLTALPTTAGAPFDMLAEIDIDSANPTVMTFAGDTSRSPSAGGDPIGLSAPTFVSTVPEPNSALLALPVGLLAMLRLRVYRRRLR